MSGAAFESGQAQGPSRQVFIGGCGRSGTTLLAAMLGAHSDAVTTPESQFKHELHSRLHRRRGERVLAGIQGHWRFAIWELQIPGSDAAGCDYAGVLSLLARRHAQRRGRPEADVWVDHTPENIEQTNLLAALFPRAKFLHLVRDGRAAAASVMPLDWGPNTVLRAGYWWRNRVRAGLTAERTLGAVRMQRVRYEDLVREPEQTLRSVAAFLELPWEPAMLHGKGFATPRYTRGQHGLVGREPEAERIDAWRKRLDARSVELFEAVAGAELSRVGYDVPQLEALRAPSGREWAAQLVRELRAELWTNPRARLRRRGPYYRAAHARQPAYPQPEADSTPSSSG